MGEQKERAERAARLKKARLNKLKEMSAVVLAYAVARGIVDLSAWLGTPFHIGLGVMAGGWALWYIWSAEE